MNAKLKEALAILTEAYDSADSVEDELREVVSYANDTRTSADNAGNSAASVKSEIEDAVKILDDAIKDMGEGIDKHEIENYMRLQYTQIGDAMQSLDQMRERMLARARQWDIDIEEAPNA